MGTGCKTVIRVILLILIWQLEHGRITASVLSVEYGQENQVMEEMYLVKKEFLLLEILEDMILCL